MIGSTAADVPQDAIIDLSDEYKARWAQLCEKATEPGGAFSIVEPEQVSDEVVETFEDGSARIVSRITGERSLSLLLPPHAWHMTPDGAQVHADGVEQWRRLCDQAAQPGGALHGLPPDGVGEEMALPQEDGSLLVYVPITADAELAMMVPPGHWWMR